MSQRIKLSIPRKAFNAAKHALKDANDQVFAAQNAMSSLVESHLKMLAPGQRVTLKNPVRYHDLDAENPWIGSIGMNEYGDEIVGFDPSDPEGEISLSNLEPSAVLEVFEQIPLKG